MKESNVFEVITAENQFTEPIVIGDGRIIVSGGSASTVTLQIQDGGNSFVDVAAFSGDSVKSIEGMNMVFRAGVKTGNFVDAVNITIKA